MKINTSDKIMAYLALFSGLTISAVAIYYSVAGLVSIFAAAAVPIIVMGAVLEISKLIATVWLKLNWQRAPAFIRTYLLIAIAILMLITSMGIFGFLSKAHSDQSLVSGDVQSKIAVYDEKIKVARDNIDANRKALKQMDEAVDQVMGRSQDTQGADKAVALRRGQAKERTRLLSEIQAEQKTIAKLSEERAPIAAEVRKVEAEVGPIKYIAAFVYGDNPDANVLEKAVTWVIIIIVAVFDPLAVILLLASQYSFQWFRQAREEDEQDNLTPVTIEKVVEPEVEVPEAVPANEPVYTPRAEPFYPKESWMFPRHADLIESKIEPEINVEVQAEEEPHDEEEELEILDSVSLTEKAAMAAWKHEHPNSSLKMQRRLFERGIIKELPWKEYIQHDAAEEAQRWAEENSQTEEAKAAQEWADEKLNAVPEVSWMEVDEQGNQIKKTKDTYQQNAEQSEQTLWQRIQDAKK